LEHQLDACSQPDPEAPGAPPFKVRLKCRQLHHASCVTVLSLMLPAQSQHSLIGEMARHPQAEAIIANPISYGHVHLADHLGLPLHFLWTQPETATRVTPQCHLSAAGTARTRI
jgi:hypothetical protein